jgi:hypothetical protein
MLDGKHSLRAALLLSLLGVVPLFAADEQESLWGFADPSADLCVYINTKQAEKAMEKNLWDRIRQDKDRALDERKERGGGLFNTKDRDLELMGNVHIVSMEPFCGTVDGVANISGDMMGDIDKMMEQLKDNKTLSLSPQMSKQDNLDFYTLALSGADNVSGVDFMMVPVKPNQIQFRVNINTQDAVQKQVLSTYSEPSPLIKKLSGQELAFACILSPEKLAMLSTDITENVERFAEFLKQLDEIAISAHVSGTQMMLGGIFAFKSETSASAFVALAEPFLTEVKPAIAGNNTPPRIDATGKDVSITIPVNISDAWDLISNMTADPVLDENVEAGLRKVALPKSDSDGAEE